MQEMKKILVKLKEEDADYENEYGKTRIDQHAVATAEGKLLADMRQVTKIDQNEKEALRVIEMKDSTLHKGSYYN